MKNSTPMSSETETLGQIVPVRKVRRVAKKTTASVASPAKNLEVSADNSTGMADQTPNSLQITPEKAVRTPKKAKKAAPKRKKSTSKKQNNTNKGGSPAKRRKVKEESIEPLGEHYLQSENSKLAEIPVTPKKAPSKLKKSRSVKVKEGCPVDVPQLQKLPSAMSNGGGAESRKSKGKKRNIKNSYYKIIHTLPLEVKSKIDWSKENIDEMC